jgi:signal transduction histidine kinase/GAF domain-containing protein
MPELIYPFRYSRINEQLIAKLTDAALRGGSIILIAPRFGGKRPVMARLWRELKAHDRTVVVLKLFQQEADLTETELVEKTLAAIRNVAPDFKPAADRLNFEEVMDRLWEHLKRPVYLSASNVDSMPNTLARVFLQSIQTLVQEGKVVAILSGEHDLRELVYGPNSAFRCENQWVLQGYDLPEFAAQVDHTMRAIGFRFVDADAAIMRAWNLSGGNAWLLRLCLWVVAEKRERAGIPPETPIPTSDISDRLELMRDLGATGAQILRHFLDIVAREPSCWDDLEDLVNDRPVFVEGAANNPPTPLELAGLARRENDKLECSSPWLRAFLKQYYNRRRLGDLYARAGRWKEAFERYRKMDPAMTRRPVGIDDRTESWSVISAFCSELHSMAPRGPGQVFALFKRGCRYLLGLRHVTLWRSEDHAQPVAMRGSLRPPHADAVLAIIGSDKAYREGILEIPEHRSRHAVAARIETAQGASQTIVAADFDQATIITTERQALIRQAMTHFIAAYKHALDVQQASRDLKVRNQYRDIVGVIFDALGSRVRDVGEALRIASERMLRLGYRRVLFCLVDPQSESIRGVQCEPNTPVDLGARTDYALDNPDADIQPTVIRTKKARIVPHALEEKLANHELAREAGLDAFAVVPMLIRHADPPFDEAIGTIHVERRDGKPPTQEQVKDLLDFGEWLAIALEQIEKVELLQSALDKLPEPVLITDRRLRLRYANEPASKLIGVPARWVPARRAAELPDVGTGDMVESLTATLAGSRRIHKQVRGIGLDKDNRGELLTDSIANWRNETIGAMLHIEDLNYLFLILEAFSLVANATDLDGAIQAALEAVALLRHRWVRLYLVREEDRNTFVSEQAIGCKSEEDLRKFQNHEVRLSRGSSVRDESWRCIDLGLPVVFCYVPDRESWSTIHTSNGLEATNVNPPSCAGVTEKQPGDFWIDFPLLAGDRVLGKLTLDCKDDLRPEQFAFLKVLALMLAKLLEAIQRRDEDVQYQKLIAAQNAQRKVMGDIAHAIGTRVAGLDPLLARYRRRERMYPELKDLNSEFAAAYLRIAETINGAKARLAPFVANRVEMDIVVLIRQVFKLPELRGCDCALDGERSVLVFGDRALLSCALEELVANSKAMKLTGARLKVRVTVNITVRDERQYAQIEYRDYGPGVPDEFKDRIFEDAFSRRPGGATSTGFGLGMVRRIIDAHGGYGPVEKGISGEGAQFIFGIPVRQPGRQDTGELRREEAQN